MTSPVRKAKSDQKTWLNMPCAIRSLFVEQGDFHWRASGVDSRVTLRRIVWFWEAGDKNMFWVEERLIMQILLT